MLMIRLESQAIIALGDHGHWLLGGGAEGAGEPEPSAALPHGCLDRSAGQGQP
jgi:hypothetical protein